MILAHDPRPLVAHVVFRFDVGGLENGVVNLINHMPEDAYRHAVISLTDITDFRQRVARDDVGFFAMNKAPGHTLWLYPRLLQLFRDLRPAIVHTAAIWRHWRWPFRPGQRASRVRIHGEHGRDVGDLDGSSRKYQWLRRCYQPFRDALHSAVARSRTLSDMRAVGMSAREGGADLQRRRRCRRFHPAATCVSRLPDVRLSDPPLLADGYRWAHAGGQESDGIWQRLSSGYWRRFHDLEEPACGW
jgi:hypothetical protein